MRKLLLAASLIALSATAADAHMDAKEQYHVMGTAGADKCQAFMNSSKLNGQQGVNDVNWFMGYLTAYNLFGPGSNNVTDGLTTDDIFGFMSNYCTKNPDNDLADMANVFINVITNPKGA